jgi:ATP-dependent DNA helicase RecQ
MNNSYKQAENVINGFEIVETFDNESVLLIDDMVDSKWTLTICGEKLKKNGVGKVYPFAIASTSEGGLD